MTFQNLLFDPGLGVGLVSPDFDEVVAAGAGETFDRGSGGLDRGGGLGEGLLGRDEGSGLGRRGPRDGVASNGVSSEDIGTPLAII